MLATRRDGSVAVLHDVRVVIVVVGIPGTDVEDPAAPRLPRLRVADLEPVLGDPSVDVERPHGVLLRRCLSSGLPTRSWSRLAIGRTVSSDRLDHVGQARHQLVRIGGSQNASEAVRTVGDVVPFRGQRAGDLHDPRGVRHRRVDRHALGVVCGGERLEGALYQEQRVGVGREVDSHEDVGTVP